MRLHQRIFFLLLVFLPSQIGKHWWPEWASVLGRRIDYLSPTLFLTDILIFLLLVSWFVRGEIKFSLPISRVFYILSGVTILFIVANIVVSHSPFAALYKWIKVFEYVGLFFYIVTTRPDRLQRLFYLSLGVVWTSVLAFFQFIVGRSLGSVWWLLGERTFNVSTPGIARTQMCLSPFVSYCGEVLRPYATFSHPNVMGGVSAIVFLLLLRELLQKKNEHAKWLRLFAGVSLLTVLLSFSRTAFFIVLVGSIASFLVQKKNFSWQSVIFLGVVGVGLLVLFMGTNTWSESVSDRGLLLSGALRMIASFPLFGVGLGNFLVRLPSYISGRSVFFLQPVHNVYMLLVSEVGALGVILAALWTWKYFPVKQMGQLAAHPIFVSTICWLVIGLVDHYPVTVQQGQLFSIILLSFACVPSLQKTT